MGKIGRGVGVIREGSQGSGVQHRLDLAYKICELLRVQGPCSHYTPNMELHALQRRFPESTV